MAPRAERGHRRRTRLARAFARVGRVLSRVIGAPDYESYVAYQRAHRPAGSLLSRGEFLEARLAKRYETPGARCC